MSGRIRLAALAVTVCLAASASAASAQDREFRLTPAEIAAIPGGGAGPGSSGVAGIQTTVLYGDPTAPGPYTIRIAVPPNTRIAAHTHRDERTAVVVSGDWYFGYGATAEEALVKPLPPGSYYSEPAEVAHFALTRADPAVVYIFGVGPTDTVFTAAAH
jgi:quercetin dioxygenase-like cupin family protein